MRLYYLIILFLLISCERNEKFIDDFAKNNKIRIVNLSKEAIPTNSVLQEFDDKFLYKYNFSHNNLKANSGVLNLKRIGYIKNSNNEYTKVSIPIFSDNNTYCLIQVIKYSNGFRISNIIYLLRKSGKFWVCEKKMESIVID